MRSLEREIAILRDRMAVRDKETVLDMLELDSLTAQLVQERLREDPVLVPGMKFTTGYQRYPLLVVQDGNGKLFAINFNENSVYFGKAAASIERGMRLSQYPYGTDNQNELL